MAASGIVTNREIAKFWWQKRIRMEEEDHLLSAIKAAARIRARKITDDDYEHFVELLNEDNDGEVEEVPIGKVDGNRKEIPVGIKDWWKKSQYAYLNQPAIGATDQMPKRQTSTYIPNPCNYCPPPPAKVLIGIF